MKVARSTSVSLSICVHCMSYYSGQLPLSHPSSLLRTLTCSCPLHPPLQSPSSPLPPSFPSFQRRNAESGGDMGRGHARPAGRSSRSAGPIAGVGFLGGAARSWEGGSQPPPTPLHTTYRNLGAPRSSSSGFRSGVPAQIDYYALLGLEMVTDGDCH